MSGGHEQKLTPVELVYPCSRVGCGKQATVSAMFATGWFHACEEHKAFVPPPPAVSAVTHHGDG